jgi:hypothetical protein
MKSVKKRILGLILTAGLFAGVFVPMQANAEWKRDQSGWWYTEGSSWATGWRNIDGSWYYFNPNSGYMAINTTVNGYYLKETGEWVNDTKFLISAAKAEQLIRDKYYPNTNVTEPYIRCSNFDGSKWTVRAFEDNTYKTTNIGWYYVDINTGNITKM